MLGDLEVNLHAFFNMQHFYKQRQAETGKKSSNILRLNKCYLKIIHIPHPRDHPKIIGHILRKKLTNK